MDKAELIIDYVKALVAYELAELDPDYSLGAKRDELQASERELREAFHEPSQEEDETFIRDLIANMFAPGSKG